MQGYGFKDVQCSRVTKNEYSFCPNEAAAMGIIVVSLADSICRHPDVTLESGLVPHTYLDLFSRYKLKYESIFKVTLQNKIHDFAPCGV